MDAKQLREEIIQPSLSALGLWSPGAEQLLFMTAAVESDLGEYVVQLNGPALGIYQMEPRTHCDLWANYLDYQNWPVEEQAHERLVTDLKYSTQMARLHYYRFPEPIPEAHDLEGLWDFYKKRWNSHLGKTTFQKFYTAWKWHVGDDVLTA